VNSNNGDAIIKSDIFIPIHVGRSCNEPLLKTRTGGFTETQKDKDWLISNLIGDDTGDNISKLNRQYGEMTAVYWAWKNPEKLGNPDYIGLYHFNKYFNLLDDESYKIHFKYSSFDDTLYKDIGQCDEKIHKIIKDIDIIGVIPWYNNIYVPCRYSATEPLYNILENKTYAAVHKEMKPHRIHVPFNMFIMKWSLFNEYCEYIFPLFKHMIDENKYKGREIAMIAEVLSGTFFYSKTHDRHYKSRTLGVVQIFTEDIFKIYPLP
jgi:hypothetical protein